MQVRKTLVEALSVDDDQVTLAEVLREKGYRTGGFVGAFVLDRRWGIAQGFDRFFDDRTLFDHSRFVQPHGGRQHRLGFVDRQ